MVWFWMKISRKWFEKCACIVLGYMVMVWNVWVFWICLWLQQEEEKVGHWMLWGKLSCWWAAGAGTEWGRWSLGGFQLMTAQKVWKAAMSFWFSSDENVEGEVGADDVEDISSHVEPMMEQKVWKVSRLNNLWRWVSKQYSNSYYTPCIGVYWKKICYQTRPWHVTHIFYPYKYKRA